MGAKQRARRKRREQELEGEEPREREEEREGERRPASEPTPADRVLELQKTAGNRATNAAISRWGFPWLPVAAAPQWPKEPQVIFDGKAIPLKAWSWSDVSAGAGAGGTARGRPQFDEVHVTTPQGDHSPELMQKTAEGRHIETVIIVVPGKDGKGMTVTFTDVLITSYQPSGELESWSLSFAKKEFSQSPPPAQPTGR